MASPYEEAFVTIWRLAESLDLCDEPGSQEFVRVYAEWQASGWPLDMLQFIRHRANAPCEGEQGKQVKSPTGLPE